MIEIGIFDAFKSTYTHILLYTRGKEGRLVVGAKYINI